MKKITLKNLYLKEVEQLSRSQLKEILGGSMLTSDSTHGITTTQDCAVSCGAEGGSCTTSECKSGSCSYQGASLVCVTS